MNVLETEWWSLAVPPEWWAEAEGETILVGDRDGVGCIEISTLQKESGDFDPAVVEAIVREESEPGQAWSEISLGMLSGWYGVSAAEGTAMREWYLAAGTLLLYITYSCEEENAGMDDAAVDEILDTLILLVDQTG